MSASLDQMLSQLGQLGTAIPQAYMQGRQLRNQNEDRQLTRQQLMRKMEMEEELFPFELQKAQRAATAVDQPKYAREFDTEGNLVYVPEQPGAAPMVRTDLKGMKTPEAEAQQMKFDQENYKFYVDKSRANTEQFKAANMMLPALRDSIEKGQKATGLAAKFVRGAASVLDTLGVSPQATMSLLNMNPANKDIIDSAINKLAIGELQGFKGPTTDMEYAKAAEIVGPEASTQETLLALLQVRMEPIVSWQKEFNQAREKHGDNYGKISDHMLNYESTNPLDAYETEVAKEITPKADYITVDEAWEKSKNIAGQLGSGAKQLFNEMYGALTPEQRIGTTELEDTVEGKIYKFQDGVLIGVED